MVRVRGGGGRVGYVVVVQGCGLGLRYEVGMGRDAGLSCGVSAKKGWWVVGVRMPGVWLRCGVWDVGSDESG